MMSEGEKVTCAVVTTRARKRKVGERDSLWDLIVKNDDISLTHIIPSLYRTDVKFLYDVNSETRKLIKRSPFADVLKEKFLIKQMSSISTLEFALEHKSLWPRWLRDQTDFCEQVAETNKLELLKWAREEKNCEWDVGTISMAAQQGNLEMVKYCVANECPINEWACANGLPKTVISRYSNTYTKKSKRLGNLVLPLGRLGVVISTYSNILLSVSMINLRYMRVSWRP